MLMCLLVACRPFGAGESDAPTLAELCEEHRTDKCGHHHNYVELYDVLLAPLRDRAERVLEIGVLHGDSARLWEDFFPRAQIFGIDIVDTSEHQTERIHTFVADQADRAQLQRFIDTHGSGFDLIIDDGGHTMEQQQTSFGFLFPHLRPGGIYIIEDIHTSFPHRYTGFGVEADGRNSTFAMITRFVEAGRFESRYLTEAELVGLNAAVDQCLYHYRPNRHHSDFFLCFKQQEADSGGDPALDSKG